MRTKDFDKQQRIKRAMVRLILEEGISGASISKIAREADVSSATIYVYYNSKEEMLAEVFRECSHDTYLFLTVEHSQLDRVSNDDYGDDHQEGHRDQRSYFYEMGYLHQLFDSVAVVDYIVYALHRHRGFSQAVS